jgi:pyruvate dehydrogenase E1 component
LAVVPGDPTARERRRKQVVAGAYLLRRHDHPAVTISAMGAVIPEALQAAERLEALGFGADVVCITNPGLLYSAVQSRRGIDEGDEWILSTVFPTDRARPMVTVLDGHPHTLSFLSDVNGVPSTNLGVSRFGQSGDLESVYRYHGIDSDSIVAAGLDLVD